MHEKKTMREQLSEHLAHLYLQIIFHYDLHIIYRFLQVM